MRLMQPASWCVPLLLLLAPGSCASNDERSSVATGELAPHPYTPDQIRRANPPKTVLVHRMEGADGTFIQTMSFLRPADEKMTSIQIKRMNENGKTLSQPEESRATWVELRDHASFPAARTVRTQDQIETPAGRFDCLLYTVRGEEPANPTIARLWFAFDQPGPPVVYETELDGRILSRMVLLERRQP
jgi:hypothetical protein